MCGYRFLKDDVTYHAVFPSLVVGVHRQEVGPRLLLAAHVHVHDRLMRVRLFALAVAALVWSGGATARAADAEVLEHKGRWESGYGSTWYNVVGRLKNTSSHALKWVKLRIDAVDDKGKVVASTDTYNESAEVLTVPEATRDLLKQGKVKALAAGAEERFRGSFLKDETPAFTDFKVTVVETPAAK